MQLTVYYVAVNHSSSCATATVDDDINQISETFNIFTTLIWVKIEYSHSWPSSQDNDSDNFLDHLQQNSTCISTAEGAVNWERV